MCGICGIVGQDAPDRHRARIQAMTDVLAHRGPDDAGLFVADGAAFGHRRLSVLELSEAGHQPMSTEDGALTILHNGEVYNHLELRPELESKGYCFRGHSDTETILCAYREWGGSCLQRFNGMFAFALWDARDRSLFLARDRLGIKPLYYTEAEGRFLFASEIKSLLTLPEVERQLDPRALGAYLRFLFVPGPETMFQGIRLLPPAHWLRVQDGEIRIQRYWSLTYRRPDRPPAPEEAAEELRARLRTAVKRRLISDVPLGAFLSGGVDSSGIVATMAGLVEAPVKTFTIGYGEEGSFFNEIDIAQRLADRYRTEHHVLRVGENDCRDLERLVWHLDAPLADTSVFLTYLISRFARETVTVCLAGTGGDELFAGYNRYLGARMAQRYRRLPAFLRRGVVEPLSALLPESRTTRLSNRFRQWKLFLRGAAREPEPGFVELLSVASRDTVEALCAPLAEADRRAVHEGGQGEALLFAQRAVPERMPLNRLLFADLSTYLVDDLLLLTDKMSMAVALEVRVPYLDHEFVEWAATLPESFKLHGTRRKYLLHQALAPLFPPGVPGQRKQGFCAPVGPWFRAGWRSMLMDTLSHDRLRRQGLFDPDAVQRLVDTHQSGKLDLGLVLFALVVFQLWHDRFLQGRP